MREPGCLLCDGMEAWAEQTGECLVLFQGHLMTADPTLDHEAHRFAERFAITSG